MNMDSMHINVPTDLYPWSNCRKQTQGGSEESSFKGLKGVKESEDYCEDEVEEKDKEG